MSYLYFIALILVFYISLWIVHNQFLKHQKYDEIFKFRFSSYLNIFCRYVNLALQISQVVDLAEVSPLLWGGLSETNFSFSAQSSLFLLSGLIGINFESEFIGKSVGWSGEITKLGVSDAKVGLFGTEAQEMISIDSSVSFLVSLVFVKAFFSIFKALIMKDLNFIKILLYFC